MNQKNSLFCSRWLWLIACALFMSGATIQSATAQTKTLQSESRFAKLEGARVHYVNYGKGDEALVLIHGWTQNVDSWRDQIPDFAKHYRVIAIDLPGHGQS